MDRLHDRRFTLCGPTDRGQKEINKVEKVNVVSGILMLVFELSFLIMMGFMTYNANQINSGILSGYSQVSYEDVGRLLGTNGLLLSLGNYSLISYGRVYHCIYPHIYNNQNGEGETVRKLKRPVREDENWVRVTTNDRIVIRKRKAKK